MAVREIRIWPDPALKEVATPVDAVDDEIRTLIDDLFDTMYDAGGVGLAANQVGVCKRVLVIDLDPKNEAEGDPEYAESLRSWGYEQPVALVNPEIVEADGQIDWDEGCLSVPGIVAPVKRSEHVKVSALDRDGQPFTFEARGLFAIAVQHEKDHLDGKVFVEYLSKLKRDMIKRKMLRLKAQPESAAEPAAAAL